MRLSRSAGALTPGEFARSRNRAVTDGSFGTMAMLLNLIPVVSILFGCEWLGCSSDDPRLTHSHYVHWRGTLGG